MNEPNLGSDTLSIFRKHGALLEGHFLLSSGLHSDRYLQAALVLQYPEIARTLGKQLAEQVAAFVPTVVVSPALGGLFVGHEVARALGVRSIFAERAAGQMSLRRGFRVTEDDTALIVEDVITTGRSTRETMAVVRSHHGRVIAVGALIDRSGGQANFEVPLRTLATMEVPAYLPESCPLCKAAIPLVKPGSRIAAAPES